MDVIPSLDPVPLPAPYWVFKLLLVLTFILHILAMNFVLGGGVLAAVSSLLGRRDANHKRMAADLGKKIPVFLPATITLGIAPLLFLQVLYGQYFYSSSILIGWPWFLVLGLLVFAYYGFYFVSMRGERSPKPARIVLWMSVLFVLIIGFIYSNNMTLGQAPGRWAEIYFTDPSGWNLNLGDATLVPRYLHFVVAAIALGGLLAAFIGIARWDRDREYARFLVRTGGRWFMFATMVQFLSGLWFLFSLPREQLLVFMGGDATASAMFAVGLLGGLAAIFLVSNALREEDPRRGVIVTSGIVFVVIAAMAIMRDRLRDAYLAHTFRPDQFTIETQWAVLPLFLALFVGGVVLWVMMFRWYGFGRRSDA